MSAHRVPMVFYSYAPEDKSLCSDLEKHLSILQRLGLISSWHNRQVVPGTDWTKTIDEHLEKASIILLLISAGFIASDYCYGIEMERALKRHHANKARVIPLLLRPVDWKGAPFEHLQMLPTNAVPVTKWNNRDEAFKNVAMGIRQAIEDFSQSQASSAPLPEICNVPYRRNPFFLGRNAELEHIRRYLTTVDTLPLAITGLGGVGKTQLALEYTYCYGKDYQMVLWARAESAEALASSYAEIARLLNLQGWETQLPGLGEQGIDKIIEGVKFKVEAVKLVQSSQKPYFSGPTPKQRNVN